MLTWEENMQVQTPYIPAGPQGRPAEPNQEKYLRHIRNILAWILALWLLGGIIAGIAIVAQAHQSSVSSTCQSQGGTDPSC